MSKDDDEGEGAMNSFMEVAMYAGIAGAVHYVWSFVEDCLRQTYGATVVKHPGDITNRLTSATFQTGLMGLIYPTLYRNENAELIVQTCVAQNMLAGYFVYDLVFIFSSKARIKHHAMFIVHHALSITMLVCIKYVQEWSPTILCVTMVLMETPTPLLNVSKVFRIIWPKSVTAWVVTKFTKCVYFTYRVFFLAVFLGYMYMYDLDIYSLLQDVLFMSLTFLWYASFLWWQKM